MINVSQFLRNEKPVNFVLLIDGVIISFSMLLNVDPECKHGELKTAYRALKLPELSRNGPQIHVSRTNCMMEHLMQTYSQRR